MQHSNQLGTFPMFKRGISKISRAGQKFCAFFRCSKRQDNPQLQVVNCHIKINIPPQSTNNFSGAVVNDDAGARRPRRAAPNGTTGNEAGARRPRRAAPNATTGNDAGARRPRRAAPNAAACNHTEARPVAPVPHAAVVAANVVAVGDDTEARRVTQHAAVVAPNVAVGDDTEARRVTQHAAVVGPNVVAVGDDTEARRVQIVVAPHPAVAAPNAAVGIGNDDAILGAVFVDALWEKLRVIISMEREQLGPALGVAAFATITMSVRSVVTKPAAGPIFGVYIKAYYMSLGGTSVLAVVEAVTAIWVFKSHATSPGCLFFGRSVLCIGVVVLFFLTQV